MYLRYMPKLLTLLLILALLSCKGEETREPKESSAPQGLQIDSLQDVTKPNAIAIEMLRKWPEFNALEQSLQAIPNVDSRSELNIVLDNVEEKIILLKDSEFPEDFDTPRVKSRIKVMRTLMLKAKADIAYRNDPAATVKELWEAYGNLNRAFNVIANNNLDTKLLLDEE